MNERTIASGSINFFAFRIDKYLFAAPMETVEYTVALDGDVKLALPLDSSGSIVCMAKTDGEIASPIVRLPGMPYEAPRVDSGQLIVLFKVDGRRTGLLAWDVEALTVPIDDIYKGDAIIPKCFMHNGVMYMVFDAAEAFAAINTDPDLWADAV